MASLSKIVSSAKSEKQQDEEQKGNEDQCWHLEPIAAQRAGTTISNCIALHTLRVSLLVQQRFFTEILARIFTRSG